MTASDQYTLSAADAQRVADATRRTEELAYQLQAQQAARKTPSPIYTGMRCTCAENIPANSVAMIVSLSATTTGLYTVKKPDADDATEVVFVPKAITAGETGLCFAPYDSDRRNMVTVTGSPAVGAEVGTTSGVWTLSTGNKGFKVQGQSGGLAYCRPFHQGVMKSTSTFSDISFSAGTSSGTYTTSWVALDNSLTVSNNLSVIISAPGDNPNAYGVLRLDSELDTGLSTPFLEVRVQGQESDLTEHTLSQYRLERNPESWSPGLVFSVSSSFLSFSDYFADADATFGKTIEKVRIYFLWGNINTANNGIIFDGGHISNTFIMNLHTYRQ